MKLIPNFQQLLLSDNAEQLPAQFSKWWEFGDSDILFQKEYKEQFGFEPHDTYGKSIVLSAATLLSEIECVKKKIGFNRRKSTPKEYELQEMFSGLYDEFLIRHMCHLFLSLRRYREFQSELQMHQECFCDGINGLELSLAFANWQEATSED